MYTAGMSLAAALKKGQDCVGVAVVFLIHDGKGNILLHKRSKEARDERSTWDAGGGGLEFGDTVEETLRREVQEEFCADVIEYEFMGFRDVHRTHEGRPTHWIALDFKVLVDPAQVKIGEPHKVDDIGWFRLEAFPSPLHSKFPRFLEQHRHFLERL